VESRKIYTEFPGETKGNVENAYIFGYIATKIYAIPFVNKKKKRPNKTKKPRNVNRNRNEVNGGAKRKTSY